MTETVKTIEYSLYSTDDLNLMAEAIVAHRKNLISIIVKDDCFEVNFRGFDI